MSILSRLESQNRHFHIPKNGFAAAVAYAAVAAVAANKDPALAVKLIASVEEVLAAMVTGHLGLGTECPLEPRGSPLDPMGPRDFPRGYIKVQGELEAKLGGCGHQ